MDNKQTDKKIKILVLSDGIMADTGFGTCNRHLFERLLKTKKYEIHHISVNWKGDPHRYEKWDNYYAYPTTGSPYGNDRLLPLLYKVQPDILYILNDFDACGFVPEALAQYREKTGNSPKFLLWFPVDGEPIYPEWTEFIKRFVDKPIVLSKYGQQVIKRTDPTLEVEQIYHGVNDGFYPLPKERVDELKKNFKDKFIVLASGTNQLRKQYPILMEAFKKFSEGKDDVLLWLHTQRDMSVGWNLDKLSRLFGISDKVAFTDGIMGPVGIPTEDLNVIYNVADVYVTTHAGEGYGLISVENMAAGNPIIYHDVTAQTEIVAGAGYKIGTDHYTIFPNRDRELIRPIASSGEVLKALNFFYEDRTRIDEYSKKSLKRVEELKKEGHDWDFIAKRFDEIFTELLEDKEEELDLMEIL